jgi:hypothetical protein
MKSFEGSQLLWPENKEWMTTKDTILIPSRSKYFVIQSLRLHECCKLSATPIQNASGTKNDAREMTNRVSFPASKKHLLSEE